MSLVIRRAQAGDIPALVGLWQELAEMHAEFAPEWELIPDAAQFWRGHAAQMLEQENRCIFVAVQDGSVIGFIAGAITDNPPPFRVKRVGNITDAIVTSSLRRNGIGEQLFQALKAWFSERDIKIVHLHAAKANSAGQAFWHRMGFRDLMSRMRGEFD